MGEMVVAPSMNLTNNVADLKLRKKRNLITLEKIIHEQWIPWAPPWKQSNVQNLRHYVSKRNLSLTSMSWKLPLTMPIKLTVRDRKQSNATKDLLEIPSKGTRMS